MRKNVKIPKKVSVARGITLKFGSILMAVFVMVIINLLASSSCQQMMKAIGEKERLVNRLEDERQRESARWEEMKTPEQLERMLLKHGLKMRYAKSDQIVRMQKGGHPQPGQKLASRTKRAAGETAQYRKGR